MVSILSLWLPILLSAVLVFIISSVIHMVIGYHNSDYKKIPGQDKFRDDVRKYNLPPGDYMFPYTSDSKERNSKEFQDKYRIGPSGIVTLFRDRGKYDFKSCSMVCIFLAGRNICSLCCRESIGTGSSLPGCISFCGSYCICRIQSCFDAKQHMVSEELEGYD
jgi:hypothetical protein